MLARDAELTFGIIVYDTVEAIDVGGTFGVLSMARRALPGLRMVTVAERSGEVILANGLRILADHGFDDCPPVDVAIVTGGAAWPQESENPAMVAFLRRLAKAGGVVASVCTGGMILAAAGLLAGRTATTRRKTVASERQAPLRRMRETWPTITCVEAAVVDSGPIVTGGGVALAIDTTLHLLGRFYGPEVEADIAGIIEYAEASAANRQAIGVVTDHRD